MKIVAYFSDMEGSAKKLRETSVELEKIRKEMESQISLLAQTWQGEDCLALQETFYAAGGLNEFSKRMVQGYKAFSDHMYDAKRSYMSLKKNVAADEAEASKETPLF